MGSKSVGQSRILISRLIGVSRLSMPSSSWAASVGPVQTKTEYPGQIRADNLEEPGGAPETFLTYFNYSKSIFLKLVTQKQ